ncbi:MAG: RNA polymerase sigma factor, partial [Planctomycetaceae bacterium]|nr:RNA polymerase sigma factor [Planctomycetaceae bacterium]
MSERLLSLDAGRVEDREAFAGIVRRYQNLVTALTFSMTGNLQQSEDLAQETFVAAWRRLTGEETRESQTNIASQPDITAEKIGPWLCGIARNLTNNWLRRTTRERQTPHVPVGSDAIVDMPVTIDASDDETEITREMQATFVWETLRHILATYREPLVMFYRQDASIREIADALGLTEACVRQRISRGRTMLKGEIASRFESFLTRIRPGEHFTVAVLAAIPILATGKQAMAASSAGIAAAQTATSGGGGHPLIAGITTTYWTFLTSLGPFLVVFIGTILGVWSGVRHAPTRRARLLMLRTVLEYYAFASFFAVAFFILLQCIIIPIVSLSNTQTVNEMNNERCNMFCNNMLRQKKTGKIFLFLK